MSFSRIALVSSLVAAAACAPSIPHVPPPASINYAVFDLASKPPNIPQPNDLALQPAALSLLADGAQKDFLAALATAGGFPSDQEVPITIDFQRVNVDANGQVTQIAPQLDVTSFKASTIAAIGLSATGAPLVVTLDPVQPSDYAINGNRGTLTLHNQNHAPWPAGAQIVVAIRGGADGVKVKTDEPVQASPTLFLLLGNQDLSLPENQALLPGTPSEQVAEGKQLEQIRQAFKAPLAAVNVFFPSAETASLQTFKIAPAGAAFVQTNAATGVVPVPSDLLLDPSGTHVLNIPNFGAAAGGLATLDGFSTTGLITAQTSAPILADTVTKDTVFMYDMTDLSHPVRVPDATEASGVYVSEPSAITATSGGAKVAQLVGLQPAVPVPGPSGVIALPPLKEATEYAVVITDGVKDTNQAGLSRSTISQILLLAHSLVDSAGHSQLAGVSDPQAQTLERIRALLKPVLAQVKTDKNIDLPHVSIAYTFRTQTITGKAAITDSTKPIGLLQLAALPYSNPTASTSFTPGAVTELSPTDAYAKYGIDTSVVPLDGLDSVLETTTPTVNLLSPSTGAFDPALRNPELLKVLIAVPKAQSVATCPAGAGFPAGAACAPLVVFHHGLGGTRAAMLTVANEFAKKGLVVAAIDSPKHGDRSFCAKDSDCNDGGTCTPDENLAQQGDAVAPGTCSNGLRKFPVLCATTACVGAWQAAAGHDGLAAASSNFLISGNLFRSRDTFRQDVIDQSALILGLARPPQLPATTNTVTNALGAKTIVIHPGQIYWVGQSLGSILGTLNVAANSRISRAVLNVGGGTLVDVLTNSPAFTAQVSGLLASLNIQPGSPQYLQFLLVAKWILDPAEPINVARNILGDAAHPTLPDLLAAKPNQDGKKVLGQLAKCDGVVPNPFNALLYGNIGLGPSSPTQSTAELFSTSTDPASPCPAGAVPHAFITSWGVGVFNTTSGAAPLDSEIKSLTVIAQDQAAAFLTDPTQLPPPLQTPP